MHSNGKPKVLKTADGVVAPEKDVIAMREKKSELEKTTRRMIGELGELCRETNCGLQ